MTDNVIRTVIPAALLCAGLLLATTIGNADVGKKGTKKVAQTHGMRPAQLFQAHLEVRDTLHTTDSLYLEVNLKRQNVTVHHRDGWSKTFLISSGSPWISDGMATPTGIFTVQNKVELALSRQFNDARLHNWIGVNGGIGFHGLDGTGYYGHLGKRPSSHGCIRMARDEIKKMYGMIHVGAPIWIHNENPARVIAFCNVGDTVGADVLDSTRALVRGLGDERLQALYDGEFFTTSIPPMVHLAGTRVSWHIDVGFKGKIPQQAVATVRGLPPLSKYDTPWFSDKTL